ncbi:MAG: TM0106 family RecB-like putative nuclease, partial [Gemmatimonadaceae bacterium]
MHLRDGELVLSATDLSSFLGCRHRTALDMAVALGDRNKPRQYEDPLLDILWKRGLEHERRYVESLRASRRSISELGDVKNPDDRVAATLAAMREGSEIIVQGALRDGNWFGYPDIMQRVEAGSALGSWSYEIADTKLARETRAGTVLQLCLYSEMLAVAQGSRPENFYVVTPEADIRVHQFRLDDYAAYFRLIRAQMLETVALSHLTIAESNYPDPVDHCEVCRWIEECKARRRQDDHLSLVAGISRIQRRELESREVTTLTGLAALKMPLEPRPRRGSMETYVRVREQARLQFESRGKTPPLHELLSVEPEKGLCRLPEPSPGDLFIDLEGDQFAAEGGREYLFGVVRADGSYEAKWGFTARAEREAFEWVMDLIGRTARQHPGMHVFHYAPYEPSAFKRLMGRYATREQELDSLLRAGRFIDLYAVVRQGLRAGVERYSIKNMEELYGFSRDGELPDANRNLSLLRQGLELG